MNHLIEVEVKNEGKENARLKAYFRSVYKELHTNHGTGLLTTNKG